MKSCSTMRDTTKGISSIRAALGCQSAKPPHMGLGDFFCHRNCAEPIPAQCEWRPADREIFPTPGCFQSAGRE